VWRTTPSRTEAPSAALEAAIAEILTEGAGTGDVDRLAEIGRLGGRLVLQRAIEDEGDCVSGPGSVRAQG